MWTRIKCTKRVREDYIQNRKDGLEFKGRSGFNKCAAQNSWIMNINWYVASQPHPLTRNWSIYVKPSIDAGTGTSITITKKTKFQAVNLI